MRRSLVSVAVALAFVGPTAVMTFATASPAVAAGGGVQDHWHNETGLKLAGDSWGKYRKSADLEIPAAGIINAGPTTNVEFIAWGQRDGVCHNKWPHYWAGMRSSTRWYERNVQISVDVNGNPPAFSRAQTTATQPLLRCA